MKNIGKCRVFADHYQFYILDRNSDPFIGMPEWNDESIQEGFISNKAVIHIGTRAHLNDHWVEIFYSESTPDLNGYDRVIDVQIEITSGYLSIMGPVDMPEEVFNIPLPSGSYRAYILTSNLGIDDCSSGKINEDDDKEMSDQEIEQRLDIERYKIVLKPKK